MESEVPSPTESDELADEELFQAALADSEPRIRLQFFTCLDISVEEYEEIQNTLIAKGHVDNYDLGDHILARLLSDLELRYGEAKQILEYGSKD
jgi:hypothetical protein